MLAEEFITSLHTYILSFITTESRYKQRLVYDLSKGSGFIQGFRTRINSYLRLYHLYSDPQLSKFSKMEELRFQYGVTGGEAKKKALAYIYKCKGTLPQFSSMFEPNKYILTNFSFLGVRDVSLENCILIVRGEGLDEDKMRRKMDKILSSNPGCLSNNGTCHLSEKFFAVVKIF
ncbi:hypothetical protein YC2023_106895 [Brassica napus]